MSYQREYFGESMHNELRRIYHLSFSDYQLVAKVPINDGDIVRRLWSNFCRPCRAGEKVLGVATSATPQGALTPIEIINLYKEKQK